MAVSGQRVVNVTIGNEGQMSEVTMPEPVCLPVKYARGAQPGNRNAEKHGTHAARRDLRALTRRLKDRRTREFREWMERRAVYLPHLGGEDSLSAMEVRTLDELVRAEMRIDWLTAWLDAHQLVYGRGRHAQVVPVLRDHKAQTELARQLRQDLGLKRRAKPLPTPYEYFNAKPTTGANGHTEPEDEGDAEDDAQDETEPSDAAASAQGGEEPTR